MGKRNVTQNSGITWEVIQKTSSEIDVVLEKSGLNPAEFIEVMVYTVSKYMYAMGISRQRISSAVEALSKDVLNAFRVIETAMDIIEEEAN